MLLTIDVGNTHTVIGGFEGDELRYEWRMATEIKKTEDEIGLTILHFLERVGVSVEDIEGIVIGSVVPVMTESLFYMAKKYAKSVKAYFVKSVFQPEFEKKDAEKICRQLGVDLKILNVDVLSNKLVTDNPVNRCYYCKQGVFGTILEAAKNDGMTVILDGTNASDDADDRPGMKALQEMKVLSPLRMCGYVKSEIRKQSKEAGLFVYNKPSYACLATRIPTGTEIDEEKIKQVEAAETFLFDLGFSDFRVRWMDNKAKIQMPESQLQALMEKREVVLEELSKIFDEVLLDLRTR